MIRIVSGLLFVLAFALGNKAYGGKSAGSMALVMLVAPGVVLLIRGKLGRLRFLADIALMAGLGFFCVLYWDDVDSLNDRKVSLLWAGIAVNGVNAALVGGGLLLGRVFESADRWRAGAGLALRMLSVGSALAGYLCLRSAAGMLVVAAGFGLFTVAATFARLARRVTQPSAAERLDSDPRGPVLLLRPFEVDETTVQRRFDWRQLLMFHPEYWRARGRWSFEEALVEGLDAIGPVIAVGRPGEHVQPAGAARTYPDEDSWRETIEQLVDAASVVVVVLGDSPGLVWELDSVLERKPLDRVLLVTPPGRDPDDLEPAHDALRVKLGECGLPAPGVVITAFDEEGAGAAVCRSLGSLTTDLGALAARVQGEGDPAAARSAVGPPRPLMPAWLTTPRARRIVVVSCVTLAVAGLGTAWQTLRDRSMATVQTSSKKGRLLLASPKGDLLASAGWKSGVDIRSIDTLELLRSLPCEPSGDQPLAFLDGGDTLACSGSEGSVTLFDVNTGADRDSFRLRGEPLAITAARPGELAVATCRSGDPPMCRRSLISLVPVKRPYDSLELWEDDKGVEELHTSQDGKRMLLILGSYAPILLDTATGRGRRALRSMDMSDYSPSDGPSSWTPAGVAVASFRHTYLWDPKDGHLRRRFETDENLKTSCALTPDGSFVAQSSYRSRMIRLWDATDGSLAATLAGHGSEVEAVAFTPDGERLLSLDDDGVLKAWSTDEVLP